MFYRLPTETEWEYACKAGQTDKLAKGKLDRFAWFYKNSNEKYQKPGTSQPNKEEIEAFFIKAIID